MIGAKEGAEKYACDGRAPLGVSVPLGLLEPYNKLRRRNYTFRLMRVERARAHALVVRQFLSREFFRLKLAAKCFGRSSESSFPWSQEFVLK